MNLHIDLPTVASIFAILSLIGMAFGYLIATVRKSGGDVFKQNAEGWKQASELKAGEIAELKGRLTTAEMTIAKLQQDLKKVSEEHGEVIRLNVELQLQNERKDDVILSLRGEIASLKGIRTLPVFHHEHTDTERSA